MTRFPAVGGGGEQPIASKDRAETFSETDVSLTHTRTLVSNKSIEIDDTNSTTASRPDDDDGALTTTNKEGLNVNPNEELVRLGAVISSMSDGYTHANLTGSDITNQTVNVSSYNPGDEVVFNPPETLTAGTQYTVSLYDDGSGDGEASLGRYVSGSSYPYQSTYVDITGDTYGDPVSFEDVRGYKQPNTSGVVCVEWPQPPDVYRWDAATFQRSPDGETVDIFVEESTDGGSTWTEIAGPVSRGEQIDADPDSRVRFRVELSRADTANNPTLDAIYRRWVV